jgi:2-octaprenyl-6-methoxyphenol hydroxylase
MLNHVDVLVVGGGPAGAALALGLKDSGLKVMVLEAGGEGFPPGDPRALALSYGAKLLLQRLGVWGKVQGATPIEKIHISQRGGFGRALLDAVETGVEALGFVVNYSALGAAMRATLQQTNLIYLSGAQVLEVKSTPGFGLARFEHGGEVHEITASLLVLADGGRSLGQVSGVAHHVVDYDQTAVICHVKTDIPQNRTAYERFTPKGPMALLPSGEGYDLVWTVRPDEAATLLQLDDANFLQQLGERFGSRAGVFMQTGKRSAFPLSLKYARPVIARRIAMIGNAAQAMHPVAGQGFNLGLRDAWELAEIILETPRAELGGVDMLARYRDRRHPDTSGAILFTDLLVRAFSNDYHGLNLVRGAGLALLDSLPFAKKWVARKMIFGAKG